ncbi:unnamed protein product [Gongylonema pulchrum]|uniref:Uncharacterized protein n=1 Tax=Gongylonema pulchrum TaxID=637853 RepID=A0A183EAB2_9BILA|nr:unnamed protein product [Gongylonema pulchrum]
MYVSDLQGLYQCIASNDVGERSIFIGLIVEAEIDAAITDLKVSADHEKYVLNESVCVSGGEFCATCRILHHWHVAAAADFSDLIHSVLHHLFA